MMRDSSIRARRSYESILVVLAPLSSVGTVVIALSWLTGHAEIAWRTIVVQASIVAAIPQGAAFIAAAMRLLCRERWIAIRRAAEAISLALPVAFVAQLALAIGSGVLAAPGSVTWRLAHLAASLALDGVGCAFVVASLSGVTARALDVGEAEGWLAEHLAALWPRGERYVAPLAFAYLALYTMGSPFLVHTAAGPLRVSVDSWMRAPFLALDDVVIAFAVVLVAARVARYGDARATLMLTPTARQALPALAVSSGLLGVVWLAQFCAALPHSPIRDAGLLPLVVAWRGWYSLALFALMFAHVTPAFLAAPSSASDPQSHLDAACAALLVGSLAERAVVLLPSVAPSFGLVDLFACLVGVSVTGICMVAALGIASVDDDSLATGRTSHSSLAR